MKRALLSSVSHHTRSKRPKLVPALKDKVRIKQQVVSATHVHNFMVNDTLTDWLKYRSRRGTRSTPIYSHSSGFTEFILRRGIEFEREIVKYINNNCVSVVTVSEYITDETCKKASKLMKEGVPVLHSVPVKNRYNNTQGVIDLLVRSDFIGAIVDENPLSIEEQNKRAPRLSGSYHYVVIDIKFSTLPLRSDGLHLLNSGHYPAYKAQTLIYTQAIGRIQGYTAPYAFIMGRRWRSTQKQISYGNYSCLNRLGKIDYHGLDKKYVLRTNAAIKWVRDVKEHSSSWTINPPSRLELYPNMCVDSGLWNKEKQKIADLIGEMTSIWHVGVKHRNTAVSLGITGWKDPKCTSKSMGIRGHRATVIDKIMAINRQSKDLIWPKKIKNNLCGWKKKTNEVFVDFETLSDIFIDFNQLPTQKRSDMIFMIGVGYEEEGKWNYNSFICTHPTADEEYRIMDEFTTFLANRGNPKIHYWHAEKRFWTIAENKQFNLACDNGDDSKKDHISDDWKCMKWCDLYNIFRNEPIVVKGCFKFGLKSLAKAMRKHKMISVKIDSQCNSGMTAMVKAWECYQTSKNPVDADIMKDVTLYNEFDCKVLWEIISYLRKNHI